jgi:hypothetical protein
MEDVKATYAELIEVCRRCGHLEPGVQGSLIVPVLAETLTLDQQVLSIPVFVAVSHVLLRVYIFNRGPVG